MKYFNGFMLLPLAAFLVLAGCSGGSGNDVGEDSTVVADVPADSVLIQDTVVMDTAGQDAAAHDGVVADTAGTDGNVVDTAIADTTIQDTTVADSVADIAGVDAVNDGVEPVNIALNPLVSECGGFAAATREGEDSYCGDDRLIWSVDSENGVINFTNQDVFLNCCGIHDVTVTLRDGVYVITEIDEPEEGGARCNCMCLFDFSVDMPLVDGNLITVRIDRLVTDVDGSPATAWEGEIDLTTGSGDIMIAENVGWCDDAVNIGQNPQFSACGGFQAEIPRLLELPSPETLNWTFDAKTGVVTFVDSDMCLNCCGSHSMSLYLIDDVYVLAEVDEPADGGGRCFCNCIFDYSIDLPGMTAAVIDVSVTRDVTDSGLGAAQVWAGSIDLSAGSGSIAIQGEAVTCI